MFTLTTPEIIGIGIPVGLVSILLLFILFLRLRWLYQRPRASVRSVLKFSQTVSSSSSSLTTTTTSTTTIGTLFNHSLTKIELGVIITGCDSGLGLLLAYELFGQGFTVFAGCLTETGKQRIETDNPTMMMNNQEKRSTTPTIRVNYGKLVPFLLDVTKQESVEEAYRFVTRWLDDEDKPSTSSSSSSSSYKRLHALVNNAGLANQGNVDWATFQDYERTMNINFFGTVRMTKTFLPLFYREGVVRSSLTLKKSGTVMNHHLLPSPRIIILSSISGYVAFGGASVYTSTKYALEGFGDCLRRELDYWNVDVCLIEPSMLATGMTAAVEQSARKQWNDLGNDVQERWGGKECFEKDLNIVKMFTQYAAPPERAIKVLTEAILATRPRYRYRPGPGASTLFPLLGCLPDWLTDMFLDLGKIHRAPNQWKKNRGQ